MPSRLLREGILSSDRVDQLDPGAEVFYRRLMSKVDDHGLYDARLSILRSSLYPLRVDRVREADISRWIAACEKAGLIVLYAHDSVASSSRRLAACEMAGLAVHEKPYLLMVDTRWQSRSAPKFPLPPTEPESGQPLSTAGRCKQLKTTAPLVVGVVLDGDGDGDGDEKESTAQARPSRKRPRKLPLPEGFAVSDRVRQWAEKNAYGKLEAHFERFVSKARANGYVYADWDEAFMTAIRDDWAKLRAPQAPPPTGKATAAAINARSIFKPEDSHERTIDSTAERVSDPPAQVG